ncbi:ABC1 family domain-containing protein [Ditylenchus destructor]|uniref:ABC1 family domain-containing protein n=1 Tax=Ditylenchus destructor TaxID=166010 RepID=A0AAD4MN25_9BILA|nr:ABC1 family domain-containing protein [Ditylenchus destructor]
MRPNLLRTWAKRAAISGIAGSSLYFLHKNDYTLENIGPIRFGRAGLAVSAIIVDYKWSLFGADESADDYQSKLKACHLRSANRLLDLAKKNGGVFIKVGQHVAALQYLLPDEYTSTLAVLHSKAPESKLEDIKRVCRDSMHRELDEMFTDFKTQPCGAASLAQVHEARLKSTGEKVAVKIQHPKVKARSKVDIATMEFFVRIASAVFPDFRLMWLLEETKKNLPKELDFLHEAKNADKIRRMFSHLKFLKVPKIYPEYTSEKVLTMEFCEGGQINDTEYLDKNNLNKHEIGRKIGRLYSEMIFVKGYIHCDPHPGNILIKKNPRTNEAEIVLLDHGLYSSSCIARQEVGRGTPDAYLPELEEMLATAKSDFDASFFTENQRKIWAPLLERLRVFEQNAARSFRRIDKDVRDLQEGMNYIRGKLRSSSMGRSMQPVINPEAGDQGTGNFFIQDSDPEPEEKKVDEEQKPIDPEENSSENTDEQSLDVDDDKENEYRELLVLDPFSPSLGSLPMYDGNPTVSFAKWLERFNDTLNLSSTGLDEGQKLNRLRYCLSGRARAELNAAQPAPTTVEAAIGILKGKFENDNTKTIARQALSICHQAPGERVFLFANRISEAVRAALAGEDEQVIQKRLLEEFMDRLTPDLQFQVKGARPDTYSNAYELAEHYELLIPVRNQMHAPGQISVAELTQKVNALRLLPTRRPNGHHCYYCQRPGHLIRECRKRLRDQAQPYSRSRSRNNWRSHMRPARQSNSRSADRHQYRSPNRYQSRSPSRDRFNQEQSPQTTVRFREPKRSGTPVRLATVLSIVLALVVFTQNASALEFSFKPMVCLPDAPSSLWRLPKDPICPSANWIPAESPACVVWDISHKWPDPGKAWDRVHMDYAGPIFGASWLIVVDAFSKYPFAKRMTSTTSLATIHYLEELFALFGSSGVAVETAVRLWLQDFRATPNTVTNESPASRFLGREIRTPLDALRWDPKTAETAKESPKTFHVGQAVWVRDHRVGTKNKWQIGVIVRPIGQRMYEVATEKDSTNAHIDQLRARAVGNDDNSADCESEGEGL